MIIGSCTSCNSNKNYNKAIIEKQRLDYAQKVNLQQLQESDKLGQQQVSSKGDSSLVINIQV